jgi:hypothetical protein
MGIGARPNPPFPQSFGGTQTVTQKGEKRRIQNCHSKKAFLPFPSLLRLAVRNDGRRWVSRVPAPDGRVEPRGRLVVHGAARVAEEHRDCPRGDGRRLLRGRELHGEPRAGACFFSTPSPPFPLLPPPLFFAAVTFSGVLLTRWTPEDVHVPDSDGQGTEMRVSVSSSCGGRACPLLVYPRATQNTQGGDQVLPLILSPFLRGNA